MRERALPSTLQKFLIVFSLLALAAFAAASGNHVATHSSQAATQQPANPAPNVDLTPSVTPQAGNTKACAFCIRANMDFLASDALHGRGSSTPDELVAATYVGAQLEQYGVEPAGDNGTYVQRGTLIRQNLTAPPELHYMTPGDGIPSQTMTWTHGKEMLVVVLSDANFRGTLKRLDANKVSGPDVEKHPGAAPAGTSLEGHVVLVTGQDRKKIRGAVLAALQDGAVAVLEPAPPQLLDTWDSRGKVVPELPVRLECGGRAELGSDGNIFAVSEKALERLKEIPDGVMFYMEATVSAPKKSYTWNALGKIPGSDPSLSKSALLLSAHLDHLGVGKPVKGDSIYNGADDDASGVVAVLELARALASGPKPKRPVLFALFGSEELGGLGSAWFQRHPPIPLDEIAVNLEFEMIGRPDPKYPADSLWLSGWERSNLGPTLAEHGAKLVGDQRPEQNFFMRSDNYVLAKRGVVAQTASSYGMHSDYHQPSDDIAHIDFKHMTEAIGSLIGPVEWLVNSDFRPEWKPGGKP
jgi:aminopeptidase YwaD